MKHLILGLAILIGISGPAAAQQPPDLVRDTYRQLLGEANDRIAGLAAQVQALTKQNEELKKMAQPPKKPEGAEQ